MLWNRALKVNKSTALKKKKKVHCTDLLLGSNETKQLMHIFCICFAVCYLVEQQENKIIVSN